MLCIFLFHFEFLSTRCRSRFIPPNSSDGKHSRTHLQFRLVSWVRVAPGTAALYRMSASSTSSDISAKHKRVALTQTFHQHLHHHHHQCHLINVAKMNKHKKVHTKITFIPHSLSLSIQPLIANELHPHPIKHTPTAFSRANKYGRKCVVPFLRVARCHRLITRQRQRRRFFASPNPKVQHEKKNPLHGFSSILIRHNWISHRCGFFCATAVRRSGRPNIIIGGVRYGDATAIMGRVHRTGASSFAYAACVARVANAHKFQFTNIDRNQRNPKPEFRAPGVE